MNIFTVVVTYNRLELLKKNIQCLRQNKPISTIVVINNGSTDGSAEWLDSQKDLKVIHQNNVGGSGGFYTGIQYAYNAGADWIWCMDDDVFPRADCLEHLLQASNHPNVGILAPRRLLEGEIFTNDFLKYNLTNPFASLYANKLAKQTVTEPTEIGGTAFEGPFIKREVVEKIGLPTKELFIFCDDTDYCLRTTLAGFKIVYVPTALMDKEKFFSNVSWSVRNKKKKWKRFYHVRNYTYLNHHYGKNIAVKYLRGLNGVMGYILIALFTCPFTDAWQFKDISRLWKAYNDGIREKLGIIK
ncbi:MAG: glycosyltransferase family 2 protein [Odoribacter sp.]|nr:glycosyltransferase family 2 protein [Odoribacter sp.]MDY3032686.1 glycosyltransferase family 2 protein [Odoribacter sp.]